MVVLNRAALNGDGREQKYLTFRVYFGHSQLASFLLGRTSDQVSSGERGHKTSHQMDRSVFEYYLGSPVDKALPGAQFMHKAHLAIIFHPKRHFHFHHDLSQACCPNA
jgi:hypothetical protein